MDSRDYSASGIPPKRRLWRNTGALAGFVVALLLLVGIAIWYTAGMGQLNTAPMAADGDTAGNASLQTTQATQDQASKQP